LPIDSASLSGGADWHKTDFMAEFPFQLLINCHFPAKEKRVLTCTSLLREIPRTRQVYEGLLDSQAVIIKVFLHKIRAWPHLRREWRKLNLLQQRQLNCPKGLLWGRTGQNRHWVLVTEKIPNAETALELFNNARRPDEKLKLLISIAAKLAKQHKKGVLQKDLHIGNFLLADNRIFALDVAQMHFSSQPLPRKKSISQLAMLARYLPAHDIEALTALAREYAQARNWHLEKSDLLFLQKQITICRKRGIKKGLKKSLRTNKRHITIEAGGHLAVFDRSFCSGNDAADFIKQIDYLMDRGQILKNGRTCYLCRVRCNGQNVVVKRYNHKGLLHSLRHTVRACRARKGWLYANRLLMLDIPTAKPLAFIENYRGRLLWQSYLVTEFVNGQSLSSVLQDNNLTSQARLEKINQARLLLDSLAEHHITHGDLKHSNIFFTDAGPVLLDLDAMTVHRWNRYFQIKRRRDLQRFERNISSSG